MARGSVKGVAVVLVFVAFGAVLGGLLASSHRAASPGPSEPSSSPPEPTTPSQPNDEPSPSVPVKELTVCQAEEPNTLFIYGGPSRAAHNVLEAIYDGPIDTVTYQPQPVILEKMPSLADGDAVLQQVTVAPGQPVMEINGYVVSLAPDVTVVDHQGQQVTVLEGESVTMTQMVVTFTLRSGVTWADGQALTADDSRYAYELLGAFDNPTLNLYRDRTVRYEAVDDRTVVWTGVPGYRDAFYHQNFFHPLPRHVWGVADADSLLQAEVAQRKPLGWGAFVVEDWAAGESITLVRNPHYFRADEGLPHLDRITFKFVPDLEKAVDMLEAGTCDVIAQDVIEGADPQPLLAAVDAGAAQLVSSPSSEWEHLDFGIQPASWVQRTDFFGDERMRHAIALCIDREAVALAASEYGTAVVANSFVADDHPLYASGQVYRWNHDPRQGMALLEDVGWVDEDGDGLVEARGVAGVAYGAPLTLTLYTTEGDPARDRTVDILVDNLAGCGVGLAVVRYPDHEFFADGPDGPVLGRQFDLALFSWLNGLDIPCRLYLSEEIPATTNWWTASNNPGYASEVYDDACLEAMRALPGTDAYSHYGGEVQRVFTQDLPVLPLYFVPKVVAVRPGVSGVVLDPSQYLELWNVEAFDVPVATGQ